MNHKWTLYKKFDWNLWHSSGDVAQGLPCCIDNRAVAGSNPVRVEKIGTYCAVRGLDQAVHIQRSLEPALSGSYRLQAHAKLPNACWRTWYRCGEERLSDYFRVVKLKRIDWCTKLFDRILAYVRFSNAPVGREFPKNLAFILLSGDFKPVVINELYWRG